MGFSIGKSPSIPPWTKIGLDGADDGMMYQVPFEGRRTAKSVFPSPSKSPGTRVIAVPVRLTDCGMSRALSVIVREPVIAPTAVGTNITAIVQLAPVPLGWRRKRWIGRKRWGWR